LRFKKENYNPVLQHDNEPRPLTSEKNRELFTKIIVIYSGFYIVLKLIAVIFGKAWPGPNLLLCLPLAIMGIVGFIGLKKKNTNWWFVLLSAVLIGALRYWETALIFWLQENWF